jgi:hypothetical protein
MVFFGEFNRRVFEFCGVKVCRMAALGILAAAMMLTGCGSRGAQLAASSPVPPPPLPPAIKSAQPILLYVGTGTSASDVAAMKGLLKSLNLGYLTADENQLNAMAEPALGGYKLLIVPGGNSITIGDNLSGNTTATIHNAVSQYGLHYLGVCAGAFFGGYSIYNGLDLTSGVAFDFYAAEFAGIHLEPVVIMPSSGSPLDVYWNDGPQLSGWGNVVATYPDGTPAIAEGMSGNGFVMLTGVHLEAPASWRVGMNFTTPVSVDLAYAGTVIQAAFNGTPLPHF